MTPFLYLPLPSWFYNKLRHSYQLIVTNEGGGADDAPMDDQPMEQVFEADTNLPIRLLFILNAIPLLNAKETKLKELEFASGTADSLAKKLYELNNNEQKEGGSSEEAEQVHTSRSSDARNVPEVRSSELVNPSSGSRPNESHRSPSQRSYSSYTGDSRSRSYTGRSYTGSSYTKSN